MFSCEFCKIFKNIIFHLQPPVAASFCYKMQNIGVNKFSATFIHNILEYHEPISAQGVDFHHSIRYSLALIKLVGFLQFSRVRSKKLTDIAAETYFFQNFLFSIVPQGVAGLTFTQFPVFYTLAFSKMQ